MSITEIDREGGPLPQVADLQMAKRRKSMAPKFPRRDSEPKKRLRENRAMTHIEDNSAHSIVLFSWSLFLGFGVSSGEFLDRSPTCVLRQESRRDWECVKSGRALDRLSI